MTRDELTEQMNSINDPVAEVQKVYAAMDFLGIPYKKTRCAKCRRDYWNIVREELGLVDDASELSAFDDTEYEYIYLLDRAQSWNGHIIDQGTPPEVIREFIKRHPNFYDKIKKEI